MGLGRRIHGGLHGRSGDDGGLVRRPRLYEITTAIGFGGRRRRVYDDLIALSGATTGDHVLDVGCGPGFLAGRAAGAVGPTGRVDGVDPSPEVIAYANRTASANTRFRVAAAERLPYPDGTFDVVVSTLALHHIRPDRRTAAMREMYRVLRTGGRLLIADFRPPRNRIVNRLVGVLGGHAMQHNPIERLPGLIADAGLCVTGQGDHRHWLRYVQAIRQ